jgi:outer membrane protein assembly factor BamB
VSEASIGPTTDPVVLWSFDTGAAVTGAPATDSDRVYVANHAGRVLALVPGDGVPSVAFDVWVDGIVWGSPALDGGGRLWLGADDDTLYAIDRAGTIVVRQRLGDCDPPRAPGPEGVRCDVDGGPVLLPDGGALVGADGVYRVASDGSPMWHAPVVEGGARHVWGTPAVVGDQIVFGGFDGNVTAVGMDGAPRWTFRVGADVDGSPAVGPTGEIYIGADDGKVYALAGTGELRWSWPTKGPIRSRPAIAKDGTIIVGSSDGNVIALDPGGKRRWSFATGGPVVAAIALDDAGNVYFGSQDDTLYALSGAGALLWKMSFPADIDAPVAVHRDGSLIVACDDGVVRGLAAPGATR